MPTHLFDYWHGKIRARDHQALASCFTQSIQDVAGIEEARVLHQLEAFFKKNAAFTERLPTRLAALISFEEGELICEKTNTRLDEAYLSRFRYNGTDWSKSVKRAQQYIQRVLGPHSDFLRKVPELIRVTGGATVTRSRRQAYPYLKINKRIVCTPGAFPYLHALADCYGYGEVVGRLVSINRVEFVPKSWKTERTIACEAEGNMFLQLAFDRYAKIRLSRVGINLSDQTRNQELAKEGSINDNLATIDLSMASDTLAYNTVALLLPQEWFSYLRAIRSQYYAMYTDKREAYHKFSSMGNGATFSLETLVFAAACHAVGSTAFSVYGDDIIIEQDFADVLVAFLDFLGFIPNTEKTYTSGPFRESCGKSWYFGTDITPRYIRSIDSRKATQCHLVNTMMEVSSPHGLLMSYLADLAVSSKLPLVPYNEDSMSGVWVDTHTAYERKLIKNKRPWTPQCLAYKPVTKRFKVSDSRALFLWHLGAMRTVRGARKFLDQVGGFVLPFWKYNNTDSLRNLQDDESSWYSAFSHKYKRKWVHWIPVAGAPDHLTWWSDLLTLKGNKSP
jgi:hypothetical protein